MNAEDADIRSETQLALTDEMTEHAHQSPKKTPDSIVLRTRRRNYPINTINFAKHSEKIALLVRRNGTPSAIDLSCYNVDAVRTMTDYMAGVDQRNIRLGAKILPDLLQLARIFRMKPLTELIVQHVIQNVERGPPTNLLLAFNLISSDWSMFLHTSESLSLLLAAAENINEVTTSTFFNTLPAAVLVILYSRCDIAIASEIELAQRLVRWLKKTVRTDEDAEVLFTCVRSAFLCNKDREVIREKTVGLPKSMVNIIEHTLDSARNYRCCVIKEHVECHMPRCGTPDNSMFVRIGVINVVKKTQDKHSENGAPRQRKQVNSDIHTARANSRSWTHVIGSKDTLRNKTQSVGSQTSGMRRDGNKRDGNRKPQTFSSNEVLPGSSDVDL